MIQASLLVNCSERILRGRQGGKCLGILRRFSSRQALLADLEKWLSPDVEFSTNKYELERHGKGEGHCSWPNRRPEMIAAPRTTEHVQEILQFCMEHRIPVIPFGAGTSVEGHVAALEGGLSLDMTHFQEMELPEMNDLQESLPDPIAKVGAGVTRKALNQALRHTGFQFVVDPGADATIGGMVATGASGTTTVLYGGMRENILEVEAIVANSNPPPIVKAGTKALKNSAGYDLVSLLCGSEGTLGVITSVTVKLHPIPQCVVGAVCVFESLRDAANAVASLRFCGLPLSRIELLDETSVEAFNSFNSGDPLLSTRKVKPTLFLEFQGSSEASLGEQVGLAESICIEEHGGENFEFASSEEDRRALWSARHTLYNASLAFRHGATAVIVTDACVPLSKFAALIEATAADVKKYDVVGPCFGHAGDGNLHCLLPFREDDSPDYMARLEKVKENLMRRTLEAGGTCTGEHGIGCGKLQYLERQYGSGAVEMMKGIKMGLDPYNIMNPGKVIALPPTV